MVKNTILGHFQDGGSAHGLLGAILDFAQNEISTISKYSMENSDPNSGFKLLRTPSSNSFTGILSFAKPTIFHYFTKKSRSLRGYNSGPAI